MASKVAPTAGLGAFAPSFREFLGYLRVEAGLAPATLEAYGRDLRQFASDVTLRGISEPQHVSMQSLAEHLQRLHREQGMEPTSVARHLATLRVYFRYLYANRKVTTDPSRLIERPTRWRRVPGVLSPAEMKALVSAPTSDHGDLWLRDRTMFELMWAAGLRASEVAALKVNDFNDTLCMLVVTGKGSKQRVVPVGTPAQLIVRQYLADLRPHLTRWQDRRDQYRLLLSFSGRPLERVAVWQIVKKYASIAQLRNVHPHTLRHSFATHLVRGGADLRVVQELLGHADIATTEIYTHVDRSALRAVMKKHHPRP
ncbi:MAG: tyrosine recombinase [Phycisphaerae bacterium]|nr:tyrosine recombinase [Phycisphaerae bacterium]